MSYAVYIKGTALDTTFDEIPKTKQVNDLANLATRNSNFTPTLKVPRTSHNKGIFEAAFISGNVSLVPYTKTPCDIIDLTTGVHVVRNGWAVLKASNNREYQIVVYDGIIDFYRLIENITLTDLGLEELTHFKTLPEIINTWTDETKPYRYILADFNGDNTAALGGVNIDYQVPCVLVKYLWDRLFEFIGKTYTGAIFSHENFTNLWMSYSKPTPTEEPLVDNYADYPSRLETTETSGPLQGGAIGEFWTGFITAVNIMPIWNEANGAIYSQTDGALVAGMFRFRFTGEGFTAPGNLFASTSDRARIHITDNTGANVNTIDVLYGNFADIPLEIGWKFTIQPINEAGWIIYGGSTPYYYALVEGSIQTTIDYIEGYSVGFDEALIDFKVSAFVQEVLTRFGVTPYPDANSDNIDFLTLPEVLQNSQVDNWTKYLKGGDVQEAYTIGNYAKRSFFRYRYNEQGSTHNDGYLQIDNQNLNEEVTLFTSNTYAPERVPSDFLTSSNVYRIWDREVRDDETLEFKGLDNRFYFMRAKRVDASMTISSNILNQTESADFYYRESYYRMDYNSILFDFYPQIKAILGRVQAISATVLLPASVFATFDFKRLIYLEEPNGYYLVNKLPNYTQARGTKAELIKVDRLTVVDVIPAPNDWIRIDNAALTDCEIVLNVSTSLTLPRNVTVTVFKGEYSVVNGVNWVQMSVIPFNLSGGNITFSAANLEANPYGYAFKISYIDAQQALVSEMSNAVVISDDACYIAPTFPDSLTINEIEYLYTMPSIGPDFPDIDYYRLKCSGTGLPVGNTVLIQLWYFSYIAYSNIGAFSLEVTAAAMDFETIISGVSVSNVSIKLNAVESNVVNP